ncbi:hypothetical protein D3C80_1798710 [compost metagenome]
MQTKNSLVPAIRSLFWILKSAGFLTGALDLQAAAGCLIDTIAKLPPGRNHEDFDNVKNKKNIFFGILLMLIASLKAKFWNK